MTEITFLHVLGASLVAEVLRQKVFDVQKIVAPIQAAMMGGGKQADPMH